MRRGNERTASHFSWLSPLWPLLFLILVWAGKELIGERWWLTTWAVYLPQPLFLIPSLGLAALALLLRRWRLLAGQVGVALLGVHGADVAIFSPHPLGSARRFALEPPNLGRVALEVRAQVHGKTVELITVHFNTGPPRPAHERAWNHPRRNMEAAAAVRAAQADHLARIVGAAGRPLVVGGDFNSPPDSYACRRMRESLQSAFASAGSGFGWSFPSNHPLLRIDHLFASADMRVLDCRVLPTGASDHCPLVADFAWG